MCLCTNQAPGATLKKAHVSLPHASITLLRLHLPWQLKIPDLFHDLDIIPALLHGDLWGGNVAEDSSGPIIFDPASFYGHSEYELAIAAHLSSCLPVYPSIPLSFHLPTHLPVLFPPSLHSSTQTSTHPSILSCNVD